MNILFKRCTFTVFCMLSLFLCSCNKPQPQERNVERPVHIASTIKMTVPVYVQSFGYLNAKNSIDIKSQVTGKLVSCNFNQGQEVKKGDLLFLVDSRLYQSQLDQATAELKQDKADLELKQFIVDKDMNLEKHGAISHQSYRQLVTDLEKLKAKISYDEAMIENNKIMLGYCQIKSPVDGVAGIRQVDAGNIVTANSGPTLVNIKTVNPLYLDFTIPEANLFRLENAMNSHRLKVLLFVDEFGMENPTDGRMYNGFLEFFNNSIDHETGTIFLRALVSNKGKKLWPGQFVRLFLVLDEIKDAVLVPSQAVNQGLNGKYIFVIDKNDRAQLHYVKVGLTEGSYVVVEGKAISAGDKVVTVGQMGLAPNVKVRIVGRDKFPKPDFSKAETAGYSKVMKSGEKISKDKFLNKDIIKSATSRTVNKTSTGK
jgi:membrane fusion protein, multidrug efflux system